MKNFETGVIARVLAFALGVWGISGTVASAHDEPHDKDAERLQPIVVTGHRIDLLGKAVSASEGVVGQDEIESRPILRAGEILEFVPGLIVTQHSGTGKANQYFLRGFNLDHGTDFSTTVDKMPVNMRTHGHGQGYTDINFVIPELVQSIEYKKGPYYADVGDFSGAGAADLSLSSVAPQSLAKVGFGENDFLRLLAVGDVAASTGNLLLAYEGQRYDGPWTDIDEDLHKHNAVLTYARPLEGGRLSLTFMGYDNAWNSPDQIPQRAVDQGVIARLGSLDTTVGGESSRYSLSGRWTHVAWDVAAYAIQYDLSLWSNFTYFLDDPVNGDQFQQVDQRSLYGFDASRHFHATLGSRVVQSTVGWQLRYDDIDEVGLHRSTARQRTGTVRSDTVEELSTALYWQGQMELAKRLTGRLGLRYDYYDVKVASDRVANSGSADDSILSPKGSLTYRFNDQYEAYLSAGQGFHSNDARGATITTDPASGTPADRVDLLVRSEGTEVGLRFFDEQRLNASAAVWMLDLDSELLFVGDAGNTEASRASRRYGVEVTAYYWLGKDWNLDAELAWTRSRFTQDDPAEGNFIDGSLPIVASAGIGFKPQAGWNGSLRVRHFGKRTLDSFDSVNSDPTTVVNLGVGHRWTRWSLALEALNLLDSKDHDIDYFYASRLSGEPAAGVDDLHFHPIEPRTLRLSASYEF